MTDKFIVKSPQHKENFLKKKKNLTATNSHMHTSKVSTQTKMQGHNICIYFSNYLYFLPIN